LPDRNGKHDRSSNLCDIFPTDNRGAQIMSKQKGLARLLSIIVLAGASLLGTTHAQVDNPSDVGRANVQLGTYDSIDLSDLYMGLQVPVFSKPGSSHLPFQYSIVGFPNVMPGAWGQSAANLSIPYPLFGGVGYTSGVSECPDGGSNYVYTTSYSNYYYVDSRGEYHTFTGLAFSPITAVSVSNYVITVTVPNHLAAGDQVEITGSAEPWLNNHILFVSSTGLSSTQFEAQDNGQANYSNPSDTGNVLNLSSDACAGSVMTYRTADGSYTLSVAITSSFAMIYTLTTATGTQLITNGLGGGFAASGWAASTNYGLSAMLYDTAGNLQITTACNDFNCTSGTTAPTFNTTVGGTTVDGNLTWTNKGLPAGKLTDAENNTSSVAVTNLTGATQTGSGADANASRNYQQSQVWTYTDAMGLNALTVTNPALLNSSKALLPTAQVAMTYKDIAGATENVYLNEASEPEVPINVPCLSLLQGPTLLGVNSTITGSGGIQGSFANPTPYPFFPTSLLYPDGGTVGFQYEQDPGAPTGSTTVTGVTVSTSSDAPSMATVNVTSASALGIGNPITQLVASGGSVNGQVTVTITGSNHWTIGEAGSIAFMSSANMVWDNLQFVVASKTSTTLTFVTNYCARFPVSCPSTLTALETQGEVVSTYGTTTFSGLTHATFLNNTTLPTTYTLGARPFNVYDVEVVAGVPYFYYTATGSGYEAGYTPSGWAPSSNESVVLSSMVNGAFDGTFTINGFGYCIQSSTCMNNLNLYAGFYFTVDGTFTIGSYLEQGVGLASTQLGTNYIDFPITNANYGPTSDSGTATDAGSASTTTGRLSQITMPEGGTIQYAYSGGTNNSGINCQDGSYNTITRTTSDGATTFHHIPSPMTTTPPAGAAGQEFAIYNWAGLYAYGTLDGVAGPSGAQYVLTPAIQGTITAVTVTGTASGYTVTVMFTGGLPSLLPTNWVYIDAPSSTVYSEIPIQIASATSNTITSTVGLWASGTYSGSTTGLITTGTYYDPTQTVYMNGTLPGNGGNFPSYTWASTTSSSSQNALTQVTDPAGNQTQYQFAGLRQVDVKTFQGTPTTSLLNSGFETGTLADWSSVIVGVLPVSGSTNCQGGCTMTDVGSKTALTDPWGFSAATGAMSSIIGVSGVAGCCQARTTNEYSVNMLAEISSGTTYTGYSMDPLPSQFTVGSSVSFTNYAGQNGWGPFTITAVCPTCAPPTFTFTASAGPGGLSCSVTQSVSLTGSELSNYPNNNELYFFFSGNTTSIPAGNIFVKGTKEAASNGQALFSNDTAGTTEIAIYIQGQAYSNFDDTSDTGTISWPISCSGPNSWDGQVATVSPTGATLTTQSNGFNYVTNTPGNETYTLYSGTAGLPSGFTAGSTVELEPSSSWTTNINKSPFSVGDWVTISAANPTASPSYIQVQLPYATNCSLGTTNSITETSASGSTFFIDNQPPSSWSVGSYILINGTQESSINSGLYDISTLYTNYPNTPPSGYYGFANSSYSYAERSDTGTSQLVPCLSAGSTVYGPAQSPSSNNISSVQLVQVNGAWAVVVTFSTAFSNILIGPYGTQFTFSGLTNATWLNGKVLTSTTWNGSTVLAFAPPSGAPEPYGPTSDTGSVTYQEGSPTSVSTSDNLYITGLNISSIPSGSPITGVAVTLNGMYTIEASTTVQAQLVHNGALVGMPKTCTIGTGSSSCTFGSTTDLWGTTGLVFDSTTGVALSTAGNGQTYEICCYPGTNFDVSINAISNASEPNWTVTNSEASSGSYSATINTQVDTQLFALTSGGSKYMPVNPGDIIQYGGDLLRGTNGGQFWWTCAFYNSSDGFISQCPLIGPISGPAPTSWTTYYTTTVAPANAAYATFYAEIDGGNQNYAGTVWVDNANFIDLSASSLLSETISCYNSPLLYVTGNAGSPQNCLANPPVSVNAPVTELDTYVYTGGVGPSTVTQSFDAYGRVIDSKFYNYGKTQGNYTTDTAIVYGTYTGTIGASANPSNCSPVSNVAVTTPICYVAVTDPSGTVWGETVYRYDANGNPTLRNIIDVTDGNNFVTSYTYTANGNLASETGIGGNVTTTNWTLCNDLMPSKQYDLLLSLWLNIDCSSGNVLSITDAEGQVWTNTYNNPLNRITNTATPMTTGTYTDSTNFTYTPTSLELNLTFNGGNSVNEALTTFDGYGRNILSQKSFSSSQFTTVQFGYNSDGMVNAVSNPFLSASGTKGSGLTNETLTFDALGRKTKAVSTNGVTTTYQYIGIDTVITTGNVVTQLEYDGQGDVVSACRVSSLAGSGPCGQQNAETGFLTTLTYNARGQVTQAVDNAQSTTPHTISFTYDGVGRMRTATRPESGTDTYVYDSDPAGTCTASTGNLVRQSDAAGNVTCYTYDKENRRLTESYPQGPNSAVTPTKNFVWDSSTTFTCPNSPMTTGRLAEIYTGTSSSKITDEGFCYSPRGDLTDVFQTTPHSGGYFHTSATYWPDGSIEALSGVPGTTGAFTYTPGYAWMNSVTGPSSTSLISSVTSTTGVVPATVTYGSGDTDNFALDTKGNFSSYSSTIGGSTLSGTWTWNANGTPSSKAIVNPFDTVNGSQTCAYAFDGLSRITGVGCTNGSTNVWGQNFAYDLFGNITKTIKSGFGGQKWTPSYSTTNNQYTGAPFTYDSDGRITNDSFNIYTWSSDGKIMSVTNITSGVVTSYTYDAQGALVEESSSNVAGHTQYVQSPVGKIATTTSTN
jgi:YD repeat-containing protein